MSFWRAISAAALLATAPALLAGEIPPDARRSGY
jgi:sulfur-oxidizing protein SoxA